MINNRLAVNCILQVKDDNRLDVEEWLKYHIALGFDNIFVCDTGNHAWLDELCEKLKDFVTLAPRKPEWAYQSEIIREYVSRREYEEWCICLTEHDFLWISPSRAKNIVDFVGGIPGPVQAVTFYARHMSSKEPMRYRVGSQLDCFVHARREPEGFMPQYKDFPNTGVTMFRIVSRDEMPLAGPVEPLHGDAWADTEMRQMSASRLIEETSSKRFRVMSYSARVYRYAIRSGVEMGFDDAKVPTGFDIVDLSMQEARHAFCHVDVNPETEVLFAKKEPPESQDNVGKDESAGSAPAVELADKAKMASLNVPVTRARIDKLIFKGMFLDDVVRYVEGLNKPFDRAMLERMFDEERSAIVASSSLYVELQEKIDQNVDDATIRRELMLTETTLARMKMALPVLDIKTQFSNDEYDIGGETGIEVSLEAPPVPCADEPMKSCDATIDGLGDISDTEISDWTDGGVLGKDATVSAADTAHVTVPEQPSSSQRKAKPAKKRMKKSPQPRKKAAPAKIAETTLQSDDGTSVTVLDAVELDAVQNSSVEADAGMEEFHPIEQVGVLAEMDGSEDGQA